MAAPWVGTRSRSIDAAQTVSDKVDYKEREPVMLELHARGFLEAITELRRIATVLESVPIKDPSELLNLETRAFLKPSAEKITSAVLSVGAKSAWVAAARFEQSLGGSANLTGPQILASLRDIESRFADHLDFIKMFVIHDDKAGLFGGADTLLGELSSASFPSIWYDCEEAAKCLCLGRATASVFHSMRMLEVAVKALARRLEIIDPVKSSQRNWGMMLNSIKQRIDELCPSASRMPESEGAFLESVYVSLDAIKNPWRNATMHVENVYTEEEARHILTCSSLLIGKMAQGFDENGIPSSDARLPIVTAS